MSTKKEEIFKNASKTFYNASRLFPKHVREDTTTLYAYVRVADDFVDNIPQDASGFEAFVKNTKKALKGKPTHNQIIDDFAALAKRKHFKQEWIDAFLAAMEKDLHNTQCKTLQETLEYVHGSAEVIGLMMCQVMGIDKKAHKSAARMGRVFQFINFIRDIQEDNNLQRQYLPIHEMKKCGLESLKHAQAKTQEKAFRRYLGTQITRYRTWQKDAEKGYGYLAFRYRWPVKTAANLYLWTAQKIEKDPFIVYRKKVKPGKVRILFTAIRSIL